MNWSFLPFFSFLTYASAIFTLLLPVFFICCLSRLSSIIALIFFMTSLLVSFACYFLNCL